MTQQDLDKYFSTVWKPNLKQYKYSGYALLEKIQPDELVLDVGCGYNEFKPYIPNLIGIDPANDSADIKLPIEYFAADNDNRNKFDVAFCLGSINFGEYINITNQISSVIMCLKPQARIYWRCNPGLQDHGNEECKNINFFPWSIEHHIKFTDMFNFRLNKICWDSNNRIYAEWSR